MRESVTSQAAEATPGAQQDAGAAAAQQRYQIGAVAGRTELSHQTLRHWDEVGLVSPSARSDGGFRLYTEEDIQRLLVVRRMKPLEFTLDEMRRLLDSLDVLDDVVAPKDARTEAAAYLNECLTRAEESLVRLRKRLAYAEELKVVLARAAEAVPDLD